MYNLKALKTTDRSLTIFQRYTIPSDKHMLHGINFIVICPSFFTLKHKLFIILSYVFYYSIIIYNSLKSVCSCRATIPTHQECFKTLSS